MKKVLIIRLYDRHYGETGNPETLAVYLRDDNTLSYSLYMGWQDSGMGCAMSNLQLKESLPISIKGIRSTLSLLVVIRKILATGVGSHHIKTYEILNRIREKKSKPAMSGKPEVWVGIIPDIHGYGLNVMEFSEDECRKALKREFRAMQKAWNGQYTYPQAMENFGGRIQKIVPGKAYYEDFGE